MTIQERRKEMGLTLRELSILCGCTLRTIVNWQKADRVPKLRDALRMAKALNVPVSELMGEPGDS